MTNEELKQGYELQFLLQNGPKLEEVLFFYKYPFTSTQIQALEDEVIYLRQEVNDLRKSVQHLVNISLHYEE